MPLPPLRTFPINLYPPETPWLEHNLLQTALVGKGGPALVPTTCIDDADIILVGIYGPRERIVEARRIHAHHAIFVWIASENNDVNSDGKPQKGGWIDDCVGLVDVSLGQARRPLPSNDPDSAIINRTLNAPNFVRWPWWGVAIFEDSGHVCRLHQNLYKLTSPDDWLSRRNFAAMLVHHPVFPRAEMALSMSKLAQSLDDEAPRADGVPRRLECPSFAPDGCGEKMNYAINAIFKYCYFLLYSARSHGVQQFSKQGSPPALVPF